MRHPLDDGRPHGRQRRSSSRLSPTTGRGSPSAPTSEEELEQIIAAGGRRGQIYRDLRSLRDRYGEAIRRTLSRTSRAECPATRSSSCFPNTASTLLARSWAARAPVRSGSRPPSRSFPHHPSGRWSSAPTTTALPPATTCPEILELDPLGLEGFDSTLVENMKRKGRHRDDIAQLPGRPGVAAGRVRRPDAGGGERARREAPSGPRASPQRPGDRDLRGSGQAGSGLGGPQVRRGRQPCSRASSTPGRGGRTPQCRRSGWASTCASSTS